MENNAFLKFISLNRVLATLLLAASTYRAYTSFATTQPWRAGFAILGITYAVYVIISNRLNPFLLALGTDGRYSLSKLQFLLWTFVIGFGVVALLAWKKFDLPDTPLTPNLFLALGFASLTALSAKALTTRQIEAGETSKPPGQPDFRQFLLDDQSRPDLTKFQMLFWTIVSIIAFLGKLPTSVTTAGVLPDISPTFLILMGLAQGTYLGTKVVTTDTPRLTALSTREALVGTTVTVFGEAFGESQGGSQIRLGGIPLITPVSRWTETQIDFTVPRDRLETLDVQVVVTGRASNALSLSIVPLRVDTLSPTSGKVGQPIDITGTGFGTVPAEIQILVAAVAATVVAVNSRQIRFTVPNVPPGTQAVQVKRQGEVSSATLTVIS